MIDFVHTNQFASTLLEEVKALPVSVDESPLYRTEYDDLQSKLLLSRLLEKQETDDLVIIQPNLPFGSAHHVLTGALGLLKMDVRKRKSEPQIELAEGLPVGIIEPPYVYTGHYMGTFLHESLGLMHKVYRNDKTTHSIRDQDSWRIFDYEVLEGFDKSIKGRLYGSGVEKALGIPFGSILRYQRSKILIVTANKQDLIKELKSVSIGGDPFEKVFPAARTDGEKFYSVGFNDLKRKPIILFASNLASATDMIKADKSIRLILIIGNKSQDLANISYINSDTVPRKVLITLPSEEFDLHDSIVGHGFDSFVWRRSDFEEMGISTGSQSALLQEHCRAVDSLIGSEISIQQTETPKGLKECVYACYEKLGAIKDSSRPSWELQSALVNTYIFTKEILQMPVTGATYRLWSDSSGISEGLAEKMNVVIAELKSALGISEYDYSPAIEELRQLLGDAIDTLSNVNPKQDFISDYLSSHQTEYVELNSPNRVFQACLDFTYGSRNEKLELTPATSDTTLIVTGWLNQKAFSKHFLSPYQKVIYIGYENETKKYRYYYRTLSTGPASMSDEQTRKALGMKTPLLPVYDRGCGREEPKPAEDSPLDGKEERIADLINDTYGEERKRQDREEQEEEKLQSSEPDDNKFAKLTFSGGGTLYLGKSHWIYKLSEDMSSYKYCSPFGLQPNEKIIYAITDRDLFEELMSVVREDTEYQKSYSIAMKWADALIEYKENRGYDDKEIQRRLALFGCKRGLGIVRSWLRRETTSLDHEAITVIMNMTADPYLLSNADEVYQKGRSIKRLHNELGKILVKAVLDHATTGKITWEKDIPDSIQDRILEYSSNISIYEISNVAIVDKGEGIEEGRIKW